MEGKQHREAKLYDAASFSYYVEAPSIPELHGRHVKKTKNPRNATLFLFIRTRGSRAQNIHHYIFLLGFYELEDREKSKDKENRGR